MIAVPSRTGPEPAALARVDGVRIIDELRAAAPPVGSTVRRVAVEVNDLGRIVERSGGAAAPAHRTNLNAVRQDLPKSLGALCSADRTYQNPTTANRPMCEPMLADSLLAEVTNDGRQGPRARDGSAAGRLWRS